MSPSPKAYSIISQPPIRWHLLAAMRFVLAFIVVGSHVSYYFGDDGLTPAVSELGAKAAVLGFFLVSGFSIAASLARNAQSFYRRRLLRIYPLYIVTIAAAAVLQYALGGTVRMPLGEPVAGASLPVVAGNLVFLQTFVVVPMAFAGPVWSLAVEVSYYLAAPLLPRLPRWVVLAVIAVSALSYAAPRHAEYGVIYYVFTRLNTLEYAWAWFMGYYLFAHRHAAVFLGFAALGAALIAQNRILNPEPYAIETFLACLVVIFAAGRGAASGTGAGHAVRALNLLGDISYPLYLLQFPILIGAWALFGVGDGIAVLGLCIAGSAIAYYGVDVWGKRSVVGSWPAIVTGQARARRRTLVAGRGREYTSGEE